MKRVSGGILFGTTCWGHSVRTIRLNPCASDGSRQNGALELMEMVQRDLLYIQEASRRGLTRRCSGNHWQLPRLNFRMTSRLHLQPLATSPVSAELVYR